MYKSSKVKSQGATLWMNFVNMEKRGQRYVIQCIHLFLSSTNTENMEAANEMCTAFAALTQNNNIRFRVLLLQ